MSELFNLKVSPTVLEVDFRDLEKVARKILDVNKGNVIFSGSFALKLQNVSLRRSPADLDVYLVPNTLFVRPEGVEKTDDYDWIDSEECGYENSEERNFDIHAYDVDGIKVDVFTPNNLTVFTKHQIVTRNGLPLLKYSEIIKFKIEHANGTAFSRFKHRNDIIHMMVNIQD